MSLFKNLTTNDHEETQDRLGGFRVYDTNIYEALIKAVYAGKSSNGATSITVIAEMGGTEFTSTQYVTKTNGENFFRNKQDNTKKVSLPGFVIIDDLCLVTTGKPLSEQDVEDKVIKLYNYDEQKEIPTSVPMLVDLIGQTAFFAVFNDLVNKNEKDASGEYKPTAETRNENVIDKVFHSPSKVTVVEAREAEKNGKTPEPVFYDAWIKKNVQKEDTVRDRRKVKDGEGAVKSGRPGSNTPPTSGGSTGGRQTSSLFKS